MKILVDENIPLMTVEALRNQAFNQFDENEWRGMLVAMRDTV